MMALVFFAFKTLSNAYVVLTGEHWGGIFQFHCVWDRGLYTLVIICLCCVVLMSVSPYTFKYLIQKSLLQYRGIIVKLQTLFRRYESRDWICYFQENLLFLKKMWG